MNREQTSYLFVQVAETLRARIHKGQYPAGGYLPPVKDLEKEFGVSNITIRKALRILAADGLIVGKQGKGTQVADSPEPNVSIRISGNFRDWVDSVTGGEVPHKVHVLSIDHIEAPPEVAVILGLGRERIVWNLRRIRSVGGKPLSFFKSYARPALCQGVTREALSERSFIEVFQTASGLRLARIEQRVQAVAADMDLSALIETSFGAPLFCVDNVYYSSEEVPVAVTQIYFRGDIYTYNNTINLEFKQ